MHTQIPNGAQLNWENLTIFFAPDTVHIIDASQKHKEKQPTRIGKRKGKKA